MARLGDFRSIRSKQHGFDRTERDECQHQNDEKKHDAAVLEALTAINLDAIEQPVGCQIEYCGNQSVIDDFQDYLLAILQNAHYMMLPGHVESDTAGYFCGKEMN